MARFIAVDPGLRSGWAEFNGGTPLFMGEVKTEKDLKGFTDWLNQPEYDDVQQWVLEDYLIRYGEAAKGYHHQWDPGIALRCIGAVCARASQQGAEVELQQPSVMRTGAAMINFPYNPKVHVNNAHSAILHGTYFYYKDHRDAAPSVKSSSGTSTGGEQIRVPTRITQASGWKGLRGKRSKGSLGM